jgi:hypothetical protein
MAINDCDDSGSGEQTMMIFPPGTCFFEPDGIHQVTIQFPDQDSAILFFEWAKDLCKAVRKNTPAD